MSDFFSARLRELRGIRSKAEFARFLGVPAPMYHRYELGQVPKSHYLQVISDRCGVTIEYLLGDKPGIAAHGSDFQAAAHAGQSPPVAAYDLHVREHPPSSSTTPATPLQTACRIPASCDISADISNVQERLAKMEAQLDTLTRLLGATLAASAQHVAPIAAGGEQHKQKAG